MSTNPIDLLFTAYHRQVLGLLREPFGNQVRYRANRAAPLYPELVEIFRKTTGLADVLRDALAPLAKKVQLAFVFGSLAQGAEKSGSDVDVFVIGKASFSAVGVAQEKFAVLALLFEQFRKVGGQRAKAFAAWRHQQGAALERFACYEALQAHSRKDGAWGWPAWPQEYHDPDAPAVAAFTRVHADTVSWHAWLQWLADTQLAAVATRARERGRLLWALEREALLPQGVSKDPAQLPELTPALIVAIHAYLARSPAMLLVVQPEDLFGVAEQINVPGTLEHQHPNWQRKLPLPIEDWEKSEGFQRCVTALAAER